ncbi:TIGR03936 family radical SAM-associated protein [Alkaliphilus transvaalensis]|uniref:TIGR03936 family radical SAM-associated protein n=1 Tax=Alkaliphilus transvaalensis TaxID=114628 RepID=UPI00047A5EE7|nr:TIGR03936 family radical SAM-associated protein [Alkaliphilus transvaalensis]
MFKMRSRFTKTGDLVFISHLDLVRVFERAMRRANIPISYSQGFNPHPIMAFATALGIGVSSEAEYIDIQLDEEIDVNEFISRLNAVLPEGLKLLKSQYVAPKAESLMAILKRSIYIVKVDLETPMEEDAVRAQLSDFIKKEEIIEVKEKKKKKGKGGFRRDRDKNKVQETNIRPLIHELIIFSLNGQEMLLKMNLAAGSVGNLKPEIVVKHLKELTEIPLNLESVRISRLESLKEHNGQFVTLMEE